MLYSTYHSLVQVRLIQYLLATIRVLVYCQGCVVGRSARCWYWCWCLCPAAPPRRSSTGRSSGSVSITDEQSPRGPPCQTSSHHSTASCTPLPLTLLVRVSVSVSVQPGTVWRTYIRVDALNSITMYYCFITITRLYYHWLVYKDN